MSLMGALKGKMASGGVGGGGKGPGVALSIKAEPLDSKYAASQVLQAIEKKDPAALDDALKLHYAVCQAEHGDDDEDDEGDEAPDSGGREDDSANSPNAY